MSEREVMTVDEIHKLLCPHLGEVSACAKALSIAREYHKRAVEAEKVTQEECPCRDREKSCCTGGISVGSPCCVCHATTWSAAIPCLKCGRQPEKVKSPETVSGFMVVEDGKPLTKCNAILHQHEPDAKTIGCYLGGLPARRVTVTLGEYINKPTPKPLSDAEKIERALAHYEINRVQDALRCAGEMVAILRGESK